MADKLFSFLWSKSTSTPANTTKAQQPSDSPLSLPVSQVEEGDTSIDSTRVQSTAEHEPSPTPPPTTVDLSPSPHIDACLPSPKPDAKSGDAMQVDGAKKVRKRRTTKALPKTKNPPSPFKQPPSPSSTKLSVGGQQPISQPIPIPVPTPDVDTGDFEAGMEETLTKLLKSVPAQTLHVYLTSRLAKLPPSELISLSNILCELEPPPLRHCARCHNDFTDVENTDRSCLVEHDDNSAVVQYASRSRDRSGVKGHETFWGCCGNTVDGEGEAGPPSGWCYEGMHTVDRKRARWRDDSTPQDDKLRSCEQARCLKKHAPPSPRKTRGTATKRIRVDSTDDEEEVSETAVSYKPTKTNRKSVSPSAISVRSTRSAKRRAVSPAISLYSARRRSPSCTPIDPSLQDIMPKKKRSQVMKPRSSKALSTTGGDLQVKKTTSKAKQILKDAITLPSTTVDNMDLDMEGAIAKKTGKAKKRRVS